MSSEQQINSILDKPALPPPKGVVPNFVDPPNLKDGFTAILVVLLVASTLVVAMRMYTKFWILRRVVLEDYLILLSWGFYAIAYSVLGFQCAKLPLAVHQYNMTLRDLRETLYMLHWGLVFYAPIIGPLKVAIGIQCLRVFVSPGHRGFIFWASHLLIWANIGFYIAAEFTAIFSCTPRAKLWDPTIRTGHCLDTHVMNISMAVFNCSSDLLMLILPHLVIWNLNMPKKRKLGLSAVFLVALLACAAAAVRLFYAIKLTTSRDTSYYMAMVGLCGFPEITCGFLVACLPNIPAFINHVKKSSIFTNFGSSLRSRMPAPMFDTRKSIALPDGPMTSVTRGGEAADPKTRGIMVVTDIEFRELVMREGSSSDVSLEPDDAHSTKPSKTPEPQHVV